MAFKLIRETTIGEVLTSVSILISMTGVMFSWKQDRQIEIKKQATQMKELSIQAFSNVLSWKDLNLYLFDRAEVLIEDVCVEFAQHQDNIQARDLYWREITQYKNDLDYEILEKDLKTFHFVLLNNGLDHDSTFIRTVTYINKLIDLNHKQYLKDMQSVILSEAKANAKQTAILGNKLRAVNDQYRSGTLEIFQTESRNLQSYLQGIIVKSDRELVYPNQ
ncbi:MAG: hypothetical protein RIB47_05950 [Cyclobacteriaceae bacterium]